MIEGDVLQKMKKFRKLIAINLYKGMQKSKKQLHFDLKYELQKEVLRKTLICYLLSQEKEPFLFSFLGSLVHNLCYMRRLLEIDVHFHLGTDRRGVYVMLGVN